MNKEELEEQPNWQATFRRTRLSIPAFSCLMRSLTITGGFYWHFPDHRGNVAGATMPCTITYLIDALERGALELISGHQPHPGE